MHPDLVCPAGLGLDTHQSRPAKPLKHLKPGDRIATGRVAGPDSHLLALVGMDADRPVDFVPVELGLPLGDCQIRLFDRSLLKLLGKQLMDRIAAGDNDHPAGITVQALRHTDLESAAESAIPLQ